MICTPEQYGSTKFILTHSYTLNKGTIDNYFELVNTSSKPTVSCPKLSNSPDNTLWNWLKKHPYVEWRTLDCMNSAAFPDSDPIVELFPQSEMQYMAIIFDPDQADSYVGINDPNTLQLLYRSKYGPGTPQSFLYDTPIIGWVMYYQFAEFMWIVEIQANNILSGSILSTPSARTHFYRFLVSRFVSFCELPIVMLTKTEQYNVNEKLRPAGPRSLTTPYHKNILEWCGFSQTTIVDTKLPIQAKTPIYTIVGETKVWHRSR